MGESWKREEYLNRNCEAKTDKCVSSEQFPGFESPHTNTVYTPNQFFDICTVFNSRGCNRLVAFFIIKEMAFGDDEIEASLAQISKGANISRRAVAEVVREAITSNFVEEVPEHKGVYRLKWTEGEYTNDPTRFQGFLRKGESPINCTPTPRYYLDHVVKNEPIGVIKVVGAVIRQTLGFLQNKKTKQRRDKVEISIVKLKRFLYDRHSKQRLEDVSKVSADTKILRRDLKSAIDKGYVVKLNTGEYSGLNPKGNTYTLRWRDVSYISDYQNKNEEVAKMPLEGSKNAPSHQDWQNSPQRVEKMPPEKWQNSPQSSGKNAPSLKTNSLNIPLKQQQVVQGELEEKEVHAIKRLSEQGFDRDTSEKLVLKFGERQVNRQIDCIEFRSYRNKLPVLRRAIENNWEIPVGAKRAGKSEGFESLIIAFYAGFSRTGESVVEQASQADIEASEGFFKAIRGSERESGDLIRIGNEFGRYAQEQADGRRHSFRSAIRVYADDWLQKKREQKKQKEAKVVQSSNEELEKLKEIHRREFEELYLDYLEQAEFNAQTDNPTEYASFLKASEVSFEKLKEFDRKFPSDHTKREIQAFDEHKPRLTRFQKHFVNNVYDFWTWDRGDNPDSLEKLHSTELVKIKREVKNKDK